MTANSTAECKALYAKHELGENEIRLISLQSSPNLEDRVVSTMSVVPLNDPGKFHSISYAWGTPVCDDYILCNNVRLPVTKNLHAGLKRIREKMAVRKEDRTPPKWFMPTVWADAICINQEDDEEKAEQVQSMASIYLKATSLIIWLGEATDEEGAGVCASLRGLKSNEEASAILRELIKRPWFGRRWIVQEAVSNDIRHMLLGGTRFFFDELLGNGSKLGTVDRGSILGALTSDSALWRTPRTRKDFWPKLDDSYMVSLMDNLIAFHLTDCANPLDRIYAMLSISREKAGYPRTQRLQVDYSIDSHTLYRNVSLYYFERGWAFKMMRHRNRERDAFRKSLIMATTTAEMQHPTLPSWIPDWSVNTRCRSPSQEKYVLWAGDGDEGVARPTLPDSAGDVAVRKNDLILRGWVFRTCVHGDINCACAEAQEKIYGEASPCSSNKAVRRYMSSWPMINSKDGEAIFYVKGWKFAFTLLPHGDDGRFRLATCFLIYDHLVRAYVDESTPSKPGFSRSADQAWVVGFVETLRPDAVTTVRIV